MTFADLNKWRVRAPFVIAATCTLPFFFIIAPKLPEVQLVNQLIVPFIALIIAALYVGLDIRGSLWSHETRNVVGPQIRSALLDLIPDDLHVSEGEKTLLSQEDVFKQLTGVFWEAVDKDAQLTAHKPHFYANGAIYTTAIDVFIIGAISGILYLASYIVTKQKPFLFVGLGLVFIALFSQYVVLPRVRARHLKLSSEQLDLLRRNQKSFVQGRFREIVLARRSQAVLDEH